MLWVASVTALTLSIIAALLHSSYRALGCTMVTIHSRGCQWPAEIWQRDAMTDTATFRTVSAWCCSQCGAYLGVNWNRSVAWASCYVTPRRASKSLQEDPHAGHSSRDGDLRKTDPQSRLLHPHPRTAFRQEDGKFRRPRHISSLLRRRGWPSRHDPDLLSMGACRAGPHGSRLPAGNRLQGSGDVAPLLDTSSGRQRS